eukprot:6182439-Pleurochrysis_carterae.AAC.3
MQGSGQRPPPRPQGTPVRGAPPRSGQSPARPPQSSNPQMVMQGPSTHQLRRYAHNAQLLPPRMFSLLRPHHPSV